MNFNIFKRFIVNNSINRVKLRFFFSHKIMYFNNFIFPDFGDLASIQQKPITLHGERC